MKKAVTILLVLFIAVAFDSSQASGKGGKKAPSPFVDGFYDSRTPGVLCAWEQLNPCEARNEVFVMSETKKANGKNYYYDYNTAQLEHIDVCMREKDAPTGIIIYGLFAEPIDLDQDNGCLSPCNMLLRPEFVNRLSCHENVILDQSQGVLNDYSIEVLREYTRPEDNYFCHGDYLPPDITPAECLNSNNRYCFRDLEPGESGYEFEAYLQYCLTHNWEG